MDEDDSQDEQINPSASCSKVKRAVFGSTSGESNDESDQVDSDSGEDDDDEEEDEDGAEEDESDVSEDEDLKAEEGACGQTSGALAGMSSDEDADKCPICLNSFSVQPVATPESCEHYFCLDCILEWAKNANSCPVDRISFNSIYLRKSYGGKVQKVITVRKPVKEVQDDVLNVDLEQTNCEVCGGSDREDRLLLCDGCDAGYHMECLTPPLDAVPIEEWFCPECVSNNLHQRGSAEDISEAESIPSTAHQSRRRSQSNAARPTRAIARTQQSERVRANVNRNRITQARSSQLAPTYLIQSSWLDDTINAVVAGLNTAVYVRDLTPRPPTRRRRRTAKRRKVLSGKSSSAKVGKMKTGGTRRRKTKRRVRRTQSRKTAAKRPAMKPPVPVVYRGSENTLSNMRANIGAPSLSIYGDPFDLDPFAEDDDDDPQDHVTHLLEAKRRGISHSALRSHQPVARPVSAGLSRRGLDIPQSNGVVEAAPVPDLLGSILSGQNMLFMDSADIDINRDGSLQATKPTSLSSKFNPGHSKSNSSGESSAQMNTGLTPNFSDSAFSPGTSCSPTRPFSNSMSVLPSSLPSTFNHTRQELPARPRPPPGSSRPISTHGIGQARNVGCLSTASNACSNTKKTSVPQAKKAQIKPMWQDISELPRIPKIKREHNSASSRSHERGSTSSHGACRPDAFMNTLAGDRMPQTNVDQRGATSRQTSRSDRAGSSSTFSNSSYPTSSSSSSSSSQLGHSTIASSSSSSVSFRINSSGNSLLSRRLSNASSSLGSHSMGDHRNEKADEAKKRLLQRDKEILLASRTSTAKVEDNDIYDPFNPTMSESSSSDEEQESKSKSTFSSHAVLPLKQGVLKNRLDFKSEREEVQITPEGIRIRDAPSTSKPSGCKVKVEKESTATQTVQQIPPTVRVKMEPESDDEPEEQRFKTGVQSSRERTDDTSPARLKVDSKKDKTTIKEENLHVEVTPHIAHSHSKNLPPTSSVSKKLPPKDIVSDSRDLNSKKESSIKGASSKHRRSSSSSSESDRSRSRDCHGGKGDLGKDLKKSSGRSRSEERKMRPHSHTNSSSSNSPEKIHKKRRHSPSSSHANSRRRSRSRSSSIERSRKANHNHKSPERNDRERDRNRRRLPKDERKRSRSRSREKRKNEVQNRDRSSGKSSEEGPSKRSQSAPQSKPTSVKDKIKTKEVPKNAFKDKMDVKVEKLDIPFLAAEVVKGECREDPVKVKEVVKPIKKEKEALLDIFADSPKAEEIQVTQVPIKTETCELEIKVEPNPPEASSQASLSSLSSLITPDAAVSQTRPGLESPAEQAQGASVKQEVQQPSDSEDDLTVDMMLDNLDDVKSERAEGEDGGFKEEKVEQDMKKEGEQVLVTSGAKSKSQVKRVTWNIQEPDGPQPEKATSKLALYKRKLKQEGVRRTSSTVQNTQETSSVSTSDSDKKTAPATSTSKPEMTDGELSRQDVYLKKLHMQERAVEEVKLAIKPFYQRRDINKEEYKEILRKAVQKVCHSKSGEINPLKVGNLVKAYVDKYKHARKHKKGEESTKSQQTNAEPMDISDSP